MPRKTSKPTADTWANLLSEAIQQDNDEHPGEGWKTMDELREAFPQIGRCRLYRYVRDKLREGEIESVEKHLLTPNSTRRVRHVFYRIKD